MELAQNPGKNKQDFIAKFLFQNNWKIQHGTCSKSWQKQAGFYRQVPIPKTNWKSYEPLFSNLKHRIKKIKSISNIIKYTTATRPIASP